MPLAEPGERNPLLGMQEFVYDAQKDIYTCPQGGTLVYHYTRHAMDLRVHRADAEVCNGCPLKSQCTTSSHGRTIHRNLREHYSERVRAYHQTAAYEKAMAKRKVWVEPLFAEAKQWHGMRRFRLRQLWRVNCEALVIASGQNLKRLLQKRGWGRRPFPAQAQAGAISCDSSTAVFSAETIHGYSLLFQLIHLIFGPTIRNELLKKNGGLVRLIFFTFHASL